MARDLKHEYQQWVGANQRIKKSITVQEGRNYVRHAKNLFPLLEGFAELHPIAKTVVTTFKAVVLYEEDRKENDARVAILLLSQSDMMATLLDVNKLSTQRRARHETSEDDGYLYTDASLENIFHEMKIEITACGNSMDTYYREGRFVKFMKSQDWKARISGHIENLDRFRNSLQQKLTIQIASDIGTMSQDMNNILKRLFAPKADWEKGLAANIRQLQARHSKRSEDPLDLKDDANFIRLIRITEDPVLDISTTDSNLNKPKDGLPNQVEQLRKEIDQSLDVLCDRNQEMFELKLDYHTRQLEDAIRDSAKDIIHSLSGPYDRLENEDLKILWKEMNWIFCIDNKLFTSALFEYYLDRFSTATHHPSLTGCTHEENDIRLHLSEKNDAEMRQENLSKVVFLSHLGVINHVDVWTLGPIANHGARISAAIDRDNSGFIRISEINAFTKQMPVGWRLPQWCAYAALGDAYEARIYRIRIHNILMKMIEMQQKVLPLNRGPVAISTVPKIVPFFQSLSWAPITELDPDDMEPPAELRLLVHEKVKQQDISGRNKLASFKWNIEDEATVQMLFGKGELETYVLQISFLLLEYAYDVMQACCVYTIDIREMSRILSPLRFLQSMCMRRISWLRTQFAKEKKPKNYLKTFAGGIWHAIATSVLDTSGDEDDQDDEDDDEDNVDPRQAVEDFLADESNILQDFPLPDGILPYLKYKTWEQHIQSIPKDEIPVTIPNSWNTENEDANKIYEDQGSRKNWSSFPLAYRTCAKCQTFPILQHHYICTECRDFDFCSDCWQLPAEEHTVHEHNSSHAMLRLALNSMPTQRDWLILEARLAIEEFQEDIWESELLSIEAEDTANKPIAFLCSNCRMPLPLSHNEITFYQCMNHSCGESDYTLCNSCIHEQIVNEDPQHHQWWHPMLVLRGDMFAPDVTDSASISDEPKPSEENTVQGGDLIAIVSAISEVQAKLDSQTQAQHTRMSQLEHTVDSMATELRNFLALQVQRSTMHNVSPRQPPSHAEGDVRAIPRDLATRPGAGALPKAFTTSHIQQTPTYPSGREGDFATGNDFDNSQFAAYSAGEEERSENGIDRSGSGNGFVNDFATGNDFDNDSQFAAYSAGGEVVDNGNARSEGGNEFVNEQPEAYSASWEGGSENGNDPNDQQAAAFSDGEGAFETENFNGYDSD